MSDTYSSSAINPAKQLVFDKQPKFLSRVPGLSRSGQQLYTCLAGYAAHSGKAFPRIKTIAKDLNCSERRVQQLIKNLKDLKLIDVYYRRELGSSSIYTFPYHPCMDGLDTPTHAVALKKVTPDLGTWDHREAQSRSGGGVKQIRDRIRSDLNKNLVKENNNILSFFGKEEPEQNGSERIGFAIATPDRAGKNLGSEEELESREESLMIKSKIDRSDQSRADGSDRTGKSEQIGFQSQRTESDDTTSKERKVAKKERKNWIDRTLAANPVTETVEDASAYDLTRLTTPDPTPSRVEQLQELAAQAKAKASTRLEHSKSIQEKTSEELKGLTGSVTKKQLNSATALLEREWLLGMKRIYPDLFHPRWSFKERNIVLNMLKIGYKVSDVLRTIDYVCQEWDSIKSRMFKGKETVSLTFGLVWGLHVGLFRESELVRQHKATLDKIKVWQSSNKSSFSPPRDLAHDRDLARKYLTELGIKY